MSMKKTAADQVVTAATCFTPVAYDCHYQSTKLMPKK
jgi:hypothetical protein